jgi:uncharacterized protein
VVGGARGQPPRDPVAAVTASEVSRVAVAPDHRASGLYVGTVRHRRHRPTATAFRYRTYHALLDVDELPALDREVAWFGYNRRAVAGFRDRDHLGPSDLPVREKLRRWLAGQGVELPTGPVRVLANLRVLGHVFDPVSWWFCHDADGGLALVVAEVRNTFGESHCYLLDELTRGDDGLLRADAAKRFHVSPFLPIDGLTYAFAFAPPAVDPVGDDDQVVVHIDVDDPQGRIFDATQTGRRAPFTTASLRRVLLRNPLLPLRTVLLIHAQAVRLWWRRVPFHRKPAAPRDGYDHIEPEAIAIPRARDDERVAATPGAEQQ